MSLQTQLNSFVLRVAEEFNTVKGRTGTLTALTTTDKSSLVAAINELKSAILTAVAIDDLTVATTSTYSSSKIVSVLDALKADVLGGADPAYDTLLELQQALQNDQTGIAACAQGQAQGVQNDRLARPRLAEDQHRQRLVLAVGAATHLTGIDRAGHHGIDDLKVRWVERQRQMHRAARRADIG